MDVGKWEMVKLKDVIEKPISGIWGDEDTVGNGVPVLRTTNFTNEGIINFNNVVTRKIDENKAKAKLLKHGDIIIEKSGGSPTQPVGRVVYYDAVDYKFAFNNFTSVLRLKTDSVFSKFLFYSLFHTYRSGGTRKYQNKTTGILNLKLDRFVNETTIPLPPIPEQQKIATTLDTVADILRLRKAQLEQLDLLVKARFVEMFGDPVENPKGWERKLLGDMGTFKNGMNYASDEVGCDIRCVGVGDFSDLYKICHHDPVSTISLASKPSADYLLKNGDILFVRSNGNLALVGRSVEVFPENEEMTFSGFCIRYRNQDQNLTTLYLNHALHLPSLRSVLLRDGRGANIKNLNQQMLSALEVPLPPLPLQSQFATFVTQVDHLKQTVRQAIAETQTLFDSLMSKYFA